MAGCPFNAPQSAMFDTKKLQNGCEIQKAALQLSTISLGKIGIAELHDKGPIWARYSQTIIMARSRPFTPDLVTRVKKMHEALPFTYIFLDASAHYELKEPVLELLLALILEHQGQRKDRKGAFNEIAPLRDHVPSPSRAEYR